jgi:hypothetical protein
LAAAWAAMIVIATAAGCTPPADSRVAVAFTDNGQAEVFAYVCRGYNIGGVQVYETDAGRTPNAWEVRPPVGPPEYAPEDYVLTIPVFEIPAGWEVGDSSLSQLERGVRYSAAFSTIQGQRSLIRFTLERLAELGPGEVLTGQTDEEVVVSESGFRDAAKDDCE